MIYTIPKYHVKTKKEIDNQAISTHIFGLQQSRIYVQQSRIADSWLLALI